MKDTVAEVVANRLAERLVEIVEALEAMGLRRESIMLGMELALERLKDRPGVQ